MNKPVEMRIKKIGVRLYARVSWNDNEIASAEDPKDSKSPRLYPYPVIYNAAVQIAIDGAANVPEKDIDFLLLFNLLCFTFLRHKFIPAVYVGRAFAYCRVHH